MLLTGFLFRILTFWLINCNFAATSVGTSTNTGWGNLVSMGRPTTLSIAAETIVKFFSGKGRRTYNFSDLEEILFENRKQWNIANSTSAHDFVSFLVENTPIQKIELDFPSSKTSVLYSWGDASVYEVALGLEKDSYLSHFSAMYILGLTLQIPKSVFVTKEQSVKSRERDQLTQKEIDESFKKEPRLSNNFVPFKDFRIYLLHGMNSGSLGVVETYLEDKDITVKHTRLERTLIDIVVRPAYSGGIGEVLNAYEVAAEKRVSVNRLLSMLEELEYLYPYHQAIGFYMERAGVYSEKQLKMVEDLGITSNFYLVHGMRNMDFSERWKVFYPKGL